MIAGLTIIIALAQTGGCLPAHGRTILARDLAAAIPAFAAAPGDALIGFAPEPGYRRVIRAPELAEIAKAHGVTLKTPAEVCFAWPMMAFDRASVAATMRAALKLPSAHIQIRSIEPGAGPLGRVEFPPDKLQVPPPGIERPDVLWRGYVSYGDSQRFPVTARVSITAKVTRVVAVNDLMYGRPIQTGDVRFQSAEDFPLDPSMARTLKDVIGFLPRRLIRAGTPVSKIAISEPPAVAVGDTVRVDVRSGPAHLTLDARAESSAMRGGVVTVRNLASNKLFRARVVGKDEAVVNPGGFLQ
jgi:flagella basal body P-ring formation protein FlgA